METENREAVLQIEHLQVSFQEGKQLYPAVSDVSLHVNAEEMTALVGESGCGKTITALTAMGLQPADARILGGTIRIQGETVNDYSAAQWQNIRGRRAGMIFQEPMTALNPLMIVGRQIAENAWLHGSSREEARQKALAMMKLVGLPDPERLYQCYPHQLSGGMRQRIMIAMALINSPSLLIADEPTTALDVTIQAQIMELLQEMNEKTHTAVLLITHDLGLVRQMCSRVYVMYAGHIVESGPSEELFTRPLHPYTEALLASIPALQKKDTPLQAIAGTVPPLEKRKQTGCPFADRCRYCLPLCRAETPPLKQRGLRQSACFRRQEVYG